MSNIRPQQEQQQQQPPPQPGLVSVNTIWNYVISFVLIALILLVGILMTCAFWRIAVYKWNAWLANRTFAAAAPKKKKKQQQQQQQEEEDDDEEEEEEEQEPSPPVIVKKRAASRRR